MTHTSIEIETIQAVVDRVTSWQDGATEQTVAEELRDGFEEAGVEVPEAEVTTLAEAIVAQHGEIDVDSVLG